jgi:glycosyltransferase involved in cell wall biosynthesis
MNTSRIALVLNAPGHGGVTEVVYQLLRHLPRERFAPSLFFLKVDEKQVERMERFAALGIEIGWARFGGGKISAIAELADWLAGRRIELVHTHSYRPNLYGRMAGVMCRPAGMRIVAHYHNHYDDKWSADPAALLLERRLLASTDAMIAVSQAVRDHVAGVLPIDPGRIDVVHNGVEAERFAGIDRAAARRALGIDEGALAIGLVGRICAQKGQADFVEAAALIAPRIPRARFFLVGDIEDRALHARLVGRIDEAGLAGVVTFTGFRKDMPEVYAGLDILAAPSRWEGFPLMLLEAMASGLAVVASRIAPIEEAIGTSSSTMLVPECAPERLAEAIFALACDPLRRAGAARAGIARAGNYSWQSAAARTAAVYRRVLDGGAATLERAECA